MKVSCNLEISSETWQMISVTFQVHANIHCHIICWKQQWPNFKWIMLFEVKFYFCIANLWQDLFLCIPLCLFPFNSTAHCYVHWMIFYAYLNKDERCRNRIVLGLCYLCKEKSFINSLTCLTHFQWFQCYGHFCSKNRIWHTNVGSFTHCINW